MQVLIVLTTPLTAALSLARQSEVDLCSPSSLLLAPSALEAVKGLATVAAKGLATESSGATIATTEAAITTESTEVGALASVVTKAGAEGRAYHFLRGSLLLLSVRVLILTNGAASDRNSLTLFGDVDGASKDRLPACEISQILIHIMVHLSVCISFEIIDSTSLGILVRVFPAILVHFEHGVEFIART